MSELPAARLTCREVVELLTDHLDGALPAGERARVEAHLATCPDCTAYLVQLRTTVGALGRLRAQEIPQERLDELVRTFRAWHAR